MMMIKQTRSKSWEKQENPHFIKRYSFSSEDDNNVGQYSYTKC